MDFWGILVMVMVAAFLLLVSAVLGFVGWSLSRVAGLAETLQSIMDTQRKQLDKAITLLVSRDPMTYQALRAGDSLASYAKETPEHEEMTDAEADFGDGLTGDPILDDPIVRGDFQ